ncbi:MAG: tRNA (N6-isopentenyl adenosine(37)-C2)-methylthiotransferase MiaB [Bradymonadia bacterium]
MSRTVFVETYGCQMNESDSELMYGLLRQHGYAVAESADDADVVLLNTCAVRERAEERIFGRLGWLKSLKAEKPDVVLGVTGCMAERMKQKLFERAPYVDMVIGPDAYRRLPDLVAEAQGEEADPLVDVRLDRKELYQGMEVDRVPGVSGWLTIMRGCDKFCTFCIVPFVRGRERSLPPEEVVQQAETMVAQGFKEITLLGQTVSSYYERGCDFADLLRRVHAVEGLERIRYTSPYPNDFSDRLLDTLAELPKVGRHIHLPVQSGSDRILRDMRRGHTAEAYLERVAKIREKLPEHALTTDIIVGYPSETEADFEATMKLMEQARFSSAFMFHYSEREGTLAARQREDDIPLEIKKARLKRLIDMQEAISGEVHQAMVGREVEVLIQGPTKRDPSKVLGRTSCFKTTIFPSEFLPAPGTLVKGRVVRATSHTLFAEPTVA